VFISDRAICIFDDLIEFTGPVSYHHRDHFLNILIQSVTDENADVRQAACYGIGLCAHKGGDQYGPVCVELLTRLFAIVNDPNSRSPENNLATENAISAIGKICRYCSSHFDPSSALSAWTQVLPITSDEDESTHCYGFLCELIQAQNSSILGAEGENIPRLVFILLTAWTEGIVGEDIRQQVSSCTSHLFSKCPESFKGNVFQLIQETPSFLSSLAEMGITI
jgi:hypothetical protein